MRAVIQRVDRATVLVSGETVGTCEKGFLILLGIGKDDTEQSAKLLAEKVSKLRVFSDAAGKMNRSLLDLGYSVLLISQFTLFADTSHGNRPSFFDSAPPQLAEPLYLLFGKLLEEKGVAVGYGSFGSDMTIEAALQGPVTIILDTDTMQKNQV
jgi:D-tyrosyl-tRNA(Tyr) deacylase